MPDFNVQWINRLDQLNHVDFSLLITDMSGVIPPARVEKSFTDFPQQVNQEGQFLEDRAIEEIERIVADWNAEQAQA